MKVKGTGKKLTIALFLILILFIVSLILTFFVICRYEIKSISSLMQIDEYGMYEMTYFDDYDLTGLLESDVKNNDDLLAFILDNHSRWFPIDKSMEIEVQPGGSTSFFVQNNNGDFLFCRNFNFPYSPSLLLHTNPSDGYASISTVNLNCLGYNQTNLPKTTNEKGFKFVDSGALLSTPYLPYDGMNEKGVAISLITMPEENYSCGINKNLISTTVAVRLILDRAASVEEAIGFLSKYSVNYLNNIPCQFFIGDSSGTSAIVEFNNGKMEIIYPNKNYQIASNFSDYKNSANEMNLVIEDALKSRNYKPSDNIALELLAHVGLRSNGIDMLQWSVLYNVTNLTGEIFAHRKVDHRSFFALN